MLRFSCVLVVLAIGCGGDDGPPTVGGRVYGLARPGLVLQNNGGDDLTLTLNGPFAFATSVPPGSTYDVTIVAQPDDPAQICTVTNGAGVVGDGDVVDIAIDCVTPGIRELSLSRGVASAGDSVTLTWASTGVTGCTVDPPVVDPAGVDFGTMEIGVDATTTYTLTCEAAGATATSSADVEVTDADWVRLAGGGLHTCAIKGDGRLFCWGFNLNGQLGIGAETYVPVVIPLQESTAATDWSMVTAAYLHSCAVKNDGRLFCWGSGYLGKLGTGTEQDSPAPVQEATAASDWAMVSASDTHTCATKTDGRLFCWGRNLGGQLGDPSIGEMSLVPVQEATGATDWAMVSAGDGHTCAIKTDGRLFCWGGNFFGQLGNGATSESVALPTQEITAASDWAKVSAGGGHTCAIKTDGLLFCWGQNTDGQLGNGTTDPSATPVAEITGATDWVDLDAASRHTCATRADGRLYCFGFAEGAELAGDSIEHSTVPVQESTAAADWNQVSYTCGIKTDGRLFCWGREQYATYFGDTIPMRRVPIQQPSLAQEWAQVSTGAVNTCAVTMDGRLFCWGWLTLVDDGPPRPWSDMASVAPVQETSGATDWRLVSTGGGHTCAIKEDDRLFCWGRNDLGQLGDDSVIQNLEPVEVSTGARDWADVSVGGVHTCAVKRDGRLFCWGGDERGQLGNGAGASSQVPVQESSEASDWAQVSAGADHTCAIKRDGRLFCWGAGARGRLGTGSADDLQTRQQESTSWVGWKQVSAGQEHTCAVKHDGRLYCWGSGDRGALGIGSLEDRLEPTQEIDAAIDWREVSAGYSFTCAVRMDQRLFCWGDGSAGQLGNDSVLDSTVPVPEDDAVHTWTSVTAARGWDDQGHTCAMRQGGRLFCWGADLFGQLGLGAGPRPIPPVD